MENNNYRDMLDIMNGIGLESHVNGQQRKILYGLAWFKLHYNTSAIYLDVGTNMGNSAITMSSAIKHQDVKIPSKVYTVDDYSESKDLENDMNLARKNMSAFGIGDLLSIHVGDDIKFINTLQDDSIDMVLDDSNHSYQKTLDRLRAYVPKMGKNSVIIAHDYYVNFAPVVKAVEDFRKEFADILSTLVVDSGLCWMFCKLEA